MFLEILEILEIFEDMLICNIYFHHTYESQGNTELLAHVELYFPIGLDLDKLPQVVRDDLLKD